MQHLETSEDSAESHSKWPVVAAFVVGVLLLAAATRAAANAPRALAGDDGSRTAAASRIVQLTALLVAATDAESCSHGYVITGDAGFLAPYERALEIEAEEMAKLEVLYARDLERAPMLADVREALASQRAHMSRTVALRQALRAGDAATLIAGFRGRELTDSLRAAIKTIVMDEQSVLSRDRAQVESVSLVGSRALVVSAGSGLLLLALGLGAVIRKRNQANAIPTAAVRNTGDDPPEQGYALDASGVLRDLTARVTLEEQRRQVQKMEALGLVTAGIVQEFSSVLSTIRTNAELLAAEDALHVSDKQEFKEIRWATQRGATMIGQLVSFSRRGLLRRERVDVHAAVSGFMHIIAGILPDNIRLEATAIEGDEAALIDVGAFEQILANLCTNARDAMPDGGTIDIACRASALDARYRASHPWLKPGNYICVSVSDTGVGMDEATAERMFEPFFTTKGAVAGAGLGLTMVYGMMKDHEGMVQVHSKAGSGTVVQLYFPVAGTEVQHLPVVAPNVGDARRAG